MDLFSERTVLTVTRLTLLLKGVLEENFEHVWVEGELSNLSQPMSGHAYFTLKDSGASVRCVMFRSSLKALKFRLEEGISLIVRGRISVYEQRGDYQLICEYTEPRGAGTLQLAFMQMKERLAAEGLFDARHKQQLPILPQRVGVITSATGAAIHDILNVLKRRAASVNLLLYPVRVQGSEAAAEVAKAIDDFNLLQGADVLIVGRGGGSLEDLWAFNDEAVARAVFRSKIPIISAVGHETDWSICDFIADLRAPTPSAAAELVCASSENLRLQLNGLMHRIDKAMQGQVALLKHQLEGARRALHDPTMLLGHLGQRVDDLSERLDLALQNLLAHRQGQLARLEQHLTTMHPVFRIARFRQDIVMLSERAERRTVALIAQRCREHGEITAKLDTLSPLQTLARGYTVTERPTDGKVIRDAAELAIGERLRLRLQRGTAICSVSEIY